VYTTGYFDGTADFDPGSGTVNFTAGTGISDAFVSCLSTTGTYNWAAQMGGPSVDAGQSITLDVTGNVYTTGRFSGTADFDPSAATNSLTSGGTYDVYVSKLNTNGIYMWAHKLGGASNDVGNAIAVDANNSVFVTGYFAAQADMDPQPTSWTLTSNGQDDVMLVKLAQSGVGIAETSNGVVEFYPNPTSGLVMMNFASAVEAGTLNVYSSLGELVMTDAFSGTTAQLDMSTLSSGVYMIEVLDGNSRTTFTQVRK
jgi:hypothetical protein